MTCTRTRAHGHMSLQGPGMQQSINQSITHRSESVVLLVVTRRASPRPLQARCIRPGHSATSGPSSRCQRTQTQTKHKHRRATGPHHLSVMAGRPPQNTTRHNGKRAHARRRHPAHSSTPPPTRTWCNGELGVHGARSNLCHNSSSRHHHYHHHHHHNKRANYLTTNREYE